VRREIYTTGPTLENACRYGLEVIAGFALLTVGVYLFSFLINEDLDWFILGALNPDAYIPVLDESMILITDFSMFGFGLVFLSWEIAYQCSRGGMGARERAENWLKIGGAVISSIAASGYLWADHDRPEIFIPLGVMLFAGFWLTARTLTRCDKRRLRQVNVLFWLTLLAVGLTELSAEVIIKNVVGRPRPLSEAYGTLNGILRQVPGEVVEGGHSYVAGHASIFFAMATPMMWYASRTTIKAVLLGWALIHALSRVYVAAHFPYGSLMGACLGFLMATLVVKLWERERGSSLRSANRNFEISRSDRVRC